MPWGYAAAAAIGAVGSVAAADTQASGQQQAAQTQQGMFNTITANEQPFMQAGQQATSTLGQLMGTSGTPGTQVGSTGLQQGSLNKSFTPADYLANQDPGYAFQMQQGGQAVRNADTPSAGALSGGSLKDLMSFNQGLASTGYQNAFNRFQTQQNNIFGRLSGIAGMGQNAASNVGTSGTQLGSGIGQAQAAAGGSQAGGIVGATNSIGNGVMLSGLMNGGSNGAQNGSFNSLYGDPNITSGTQMIYNGGNVGTPQAGA